MLRPFDQLGKSVKERGNKICSLINPISCSLAAILVWKRRNVRVGKKVVLVDAKHKLVYQQQYLSAVWSLDCFSGDDSTRLLSLSTTTIFGIICSIFHNIKQLLRYFLAFSLKRKCTLSCRGSGSKASRYSVMFLERPSKIPELWIVDTHCSLVQLVSCHQ